MSGATHSSEAQEDQDHQQQQQHHSQSSGQQSDSAPAVSNPPAEASKSPAPAEPGSTKPSTPPAAGASIATSTKEGQAQLKQQEQSQQDCQKSATTTTPATSTTTAAATTTSSTTAAAASAAKQTAALGVTGASEKLSGEEPAPTVDTKLSIKPDGSADHKSQHQQKAAELISDKPLPSAPVCALKASDVRQTKIEGLDIITSASDTDSRANGAGDAANIADLAHKTDKDQISAAAGNVIVAGAGDQPNQVTCETQEVSSTVADHVPSKPHHHGARSGRRPSYNSQRSYSSSGYQNYGLAYLPYKSNFEPSEEARRRADEFLKTLKL